MLENPEVVSISNKPPKVSRPAKEMKLRKVILNLTRRKNRLNPPRQNEILAAIGTATVEIAHEIANSLNIMNGLLDLVRMMLDPRRGCIGDRPFSVLDEMASELERMRKLLEELRDVSRPAKVNIEPLKLHEVVMEIVREGSVATRPNTIAVEHQIPDDLPPVLADKEKLARVVLNLCVNAFDAMPNGGKLTLRAYKANEGVCLEIQDTGVGIPENFDPFRPFNTTKERGWGLGLAIVEQTIQTLNGTLSYTSQRGDGTTFRICLPAQA
jgi:signal transduction histidine kinase